MGIRVLLYVSQKRKGSRMHGIVYMHVNSIYDS